VVYYASGKFFEGVTWDPNSNKLFFTNMTSKQILRLDSPGNPGTAYTWMSDGTMANGMFLGIDGRLLTTDQTTTPKRVRSHRIGTSGPLNTQVLFNTSDPPNDLCQLSNGNIYVTCQNGNSANQGVYLFKNGTLTKVNNNTIIQPNGILASLDETKLYVSESSTADNSKKRWWVYPINADGTLGTGSIFFQPTDLTGMRYADRHGRRLDRLADWCGA
jgi:sugar lactone lactonase YvrE